MFDVFLVLTRNELRGYFRKKAAVFWVLVFPSLLLTVMVLAFGRASTLGPVNIAFAGDSTSVVARSCRADVEQVFAKGEPVKVKFVPDGAPVDTSAGDSVRLIWPDGKDVGATRVLYDFNGQLGTKAAARMVEMAMIGCVGRLRGVPASSAVQFQDESSTKPPFDYGNFFTTGILIMAFMMIGMDSTTTAIAALRERNTFKVYVCFPVSRFVFLASLITARIVLMLLSATTLLLVARYGFGVKLPLWQPQALRAVPVLIIGGGMLLSFGTLLASRTRSLAEAELLCNVTYYPLLFFSDLTIPLGGAPDPVKNVLKLLPTNQFAVALRSVFIDGAGYAQVAIPLAAMTFWGLLFLTMGSLRFRWYQE